MYDLSVFTVDEQHGAMSAPNMTAPKQAGGDFGRFLNIPGAGNPRLENNHTYPIIFNISSSLSFVLFRCVACIISNALQFHSMYVCFIISYVHLEYRENCFRTICINIRHKNREWTYLLSGN